MIKEKGVAYCGLACAVCGENEHCSGCRNEGCAGKDLCKNFNCCKSKGLQGCWECENFPCESDMFKKPRVLAFSEFIREYGEDKMLACLERNEKAGLRYHYPNQLIGDYDIPKTKEEIKELLLNGIHKE